MSEILNGLSLPTGLAEVVPQEEVRLFDIKARTELAVEAYKDLGMVDDAGLASEVIGRGMEAYHELLVNEGYKLESDLEVFQAFELPAEAQRGFAFRALLNAFDRTGEEPSYRYDALWNLYGSSELNKRGFTGDPLRLSENGTIFGKPVAMLRRTDYEGEPGLLFINKPKREQEKEARAAHSEDGTKYAKIMVLNPVDYIVLGAQRRAEGRRLPDSGATPLDRRTRTRFVQLAEKYCQGHSYVPSAETRDGQLKLSGSKGWERGLEGIRLVVSA